ncbi:unnamed protein product, partial [Prorocentrum cordatum]
HCGADPWQSQKCVLLAPAGAAGSRPPPTPRPRPRTALVMGLYHSCTNAVVEELRLRFDVQVLNDWTHKGECWKHRARRERPAALGASGGGAPAFCLLLVKEPRFWLRSLSRCARNFHAARPVERLGGEWKEVGSPGLRELFGPVEHDGICHRDALDLWAATVGSYFDDEVYPPESSLIVRSEDFLFRFEDVMDVLGTIFEPAAAAPPARPIDGRAKGHKESRTRDEALRFYAREENMTAGFDPDLLLAVGARLGSGWAHELAAALRYAGPAAVSSWLPAGFRAEPEFVASHLHRVLWLDLEPGSQCCAASQCGLEREGMAQIAERVNAPARIAEWLAGSGGDVPTSDNFECAARAESLAGALGPDAAAEMAGVPEPELAALLVECRRWHAWFEALAGIRAQGRRGEAYLVVEGHAACCHGLQAILGRCLEELDRLDAGWEVLQVGFVRVRSSVKSPAVAGGRAAEPLRLTGCAGLVVRGPEGARSLLSHAFPRLSGERFDIRLRHCYSRVRFYCSRVPLVAAPPPPGPDPDLRRFAPEAAEEVLSAWRQQAERTLAAATVDLQQAQG